MDWIGQIWQQAYQTEGKARLMFGLGAGEEMDVGDWSGFSVPNPFPPQAPRNQGAQAQRSGPASLMDLWKARNLEASQLLFLPVVAPLPTGYFGGFRPPGPHQGLAQTYSHSQEPEGNI